MGQEQGRARTQRGSGRRAGAGGSGALGTVVPGPVNGDGGSDERAPDDGDWHPSDPGPSGEHHRRRRGWRRVVGLAPVTVLLLLLATPVLAVLLISDALAVRASLQSARGSLQEVNGAFGEMDVEAAAAALETADADLAEARDRTARFYWSIASVLPFVGDSTSLTRDVVEVAHVAVDLVGIAVTEGRDVVGGGLDIEVVDGQVDLAPLFAARDLVAQLPIDDLVAAREQLAQPRTGWVSHELGNGRDEVLALADDVIATTTTARSLSDAMPGFLGAEGPRRYFVGMQTSAELRGTGGLIRYGGLLSIEDGRLEFGGFEDLGDGEGAALPEAAPDRLAIHDGAAVAADAEFLSRYEHLAANALIANLNLDPDLPTVAGVGLELLEDRGGGPMDGLILVDPVGLQTLLEATSEPLPLPSGLAAELQTEEALPTEDFARTVTVDIYTALGAGRTEERDEALTALAATAVERVLQGGWDGLEMAQSIAIATRGRNLQVFSRHDDEQSAFNEVRATGALDASDDADLLAVTANNVVGGKQDVHLGHQFDVEVLLGDLDVDGSAAIAERRISVDVVVENPLPTSGVDEYIIGNCVVPDGPNRCFAGPSGWNWTWFTAWLPGGSSLADTRTDDGQPLTGVGEYRGFAVFDEYLGTEPEARNGFGFDARGTVPLQRTDDGVVYELRWWRQAKAVPDLLDVTVPAPEGWTVTDVEVVGGGEGRGAGVHGEGRERSAEVVDGVARLYGTVDADTRLRVHLAEPGG